jgi:hypothetical protein
MNTARLKLSARTEVCVCVSRLHGQWAQMSVAPTLLPLRVVPVQRTVFCEVRRLLGRCFRDGL